VTCLYYISDSADAIKCYVCSYPVSDNCNDEFNPEGITIHENCQSCSKTKAGANGISGKHRIDYLLRTIAFTRCFLIYILLIMYMNVLNYD